MGREVQQLCGKMSLYECGVGKTAFTTKKLPGNGDDVPVVNRRVPRREDVTIRALRLNSFESLLPLFAPAAGYTCAQVLVSQHRREGEEITVTIRCAAIGQFVQCRIQGKSGALEQICFAPTRYECRSSPCVARRAV